MTAFAINMGVGTTNPTATGTIYAYRDGFASNDGVITIADDVTTTYLTSSAAADETVEAQYIHPDITSCGAITIAAANS